MPIQYHFKNDAQVREAAQTVMDRLEAQGFDIGKPIDGHLEASCQYTIFQKGTKLTPVGAVHGKQMAHLMVFFNGFGGPSYFQLSSGISKEAPLFEKLVKDVAQEFDAREQKIYARDLI